MNKSVVSNPFPLLFELVVSNSSPLTTSDHVLLLAFLALSTPFSVGSGPGSSPRSFPLYPSSASLTLADQYAFGGVDLFDPEEVMKVP